MLASLSMYDDPTLRWANVVLWRTWSARLRARGIEAPAELTRVSHTEGDLWRDPGLLLAQTCGLPFVAELREHVRLVGTPRYRVPGCEGTRYRGAILVRADDSRASLAEFHGARAALNGILSHSGHTAFSAAVDAIDGERPFLATATLSGSHLASMKMVAEKQAEIASVDCVTWAHARTIYPDITGRLRVLAMTPAAPGLPFVTSRHRPAEHADVLREELQAALAGPRCVRAARALFLAGVERVEDSDYTTILAAWNRVRDAPLAARIERSEPQALKENPRET